MGDLDRRAAVGAARREAARAAPAARLPGTLALTIRYSLGADGLAVTTEASNLGSEPLPIPRVSIPTSPPNGESGGTPELDAET
jgi:hypothetical protein